MPPDRSSFRALNFPSENIPLSFSSFILAASPNTDLYRKPPGCDTSTAPILYTLLRHPFVAAEVTVSADWELEWDQAGLVIFAGTPPGRGNQNSVQIPPSGAVNQMDAPPPYLPSAPASKWVKVGMELCNNVPHACSVCATSDGADWASAALPHNLVQQSHLRVKIERIGYALWIWYADGLIGWKKLREVTWFFWGVEDKTVRVGVYASRPSNILPTRHNRHDGQARNPAHRNLCVEFEDLEIS